MNLRFWTLLKTQLQEKYLTEYPHEEIKKENPYPAQFINWILDKAKFKRGQKDWNPDPKTIRNHLNDKTENIPPHILDAYANLANFENYHAFVKICGDVRGSTPEKLHQYKKLLAQDLDSFKIIGMPAPEKISRIEIKRYLKKSTFNPLLESLHTRLSERTYSNWEEYNIVDFLEPKSTLEEYKKILIFGNAGMGKTVLGKSLAIEYCARDSDYLPFYFSLSKFNNIPQEDIDIQSVICRELAQFEISKGDIDKHLRNGSFLFVFDALDEVSVDNRTIVQVKIEDFIGKYYNNRYVITCRYGAILKDFQRVNNYEILPLKKDDMKSFISNWFDDPEKQRSCWDDIRIRERVLSLSRNPLLLSLICLLFDRHNIIPGNKGKLFKTATDLLITFWDKSRGIERKELLLEEIDSKKANSLYCSLANYLHHHQIDSTSIENFNKHLKNEFATERLRDLLRLMRPAHGIINLKYNDENILFNHRLFLEHFAARDLINQGSTNIYKIVSEHAFTDSWYEIIQQLIGLSDKSEAQQLLQIIVDRSNDYINENSELKSIIKKINSVDYLIFNKYIDPPPEVVKRVYLFLLFFDELSAEETSSNLSHLTLILCFLSEKLLHFMQLEEIQNHEYVTFKRMSKMKISELLLYFEEYFIGGTEESKQVISNLAAECYFEFQNSIATIKKLLFQYVTVFEYLNDLHYDDTTIKEYILAKILST